MYKVLFSERLTKCRLQEKLWDIMSDFNEWPISGNCEKISLKSHFEPKGALELAIDDLNQKYNIKIFDLYKNTGHRSQKEWVSVVGIKYYFDLIELQYEKLPHEMQADFRKRINCCLSKFLPEFYLYPQGNIGRTVSIVLFGPDEKQILQKNPEEQIYELIQKAIKIHHYPEEYSRRDAVKILWDAFERLKTYDRNAGCDKKDSTNRLIRRVVGEDEAFCKKLDEEFQALTNIGNTYAIRHSEMNQIILKDVRLYDYLFNRCLALILLILSNLKIENLPEGKL